MGRTAAELDAALRLAPTYWDHQRAIASHDALGIVIYRPSTPADFIFPDADTGRWWTALEREAYRHSPTYRHRRQVVIGRNCLSPA